jgi:lysine 2,3-aminomutase
MVTLTSPRALIEAGFGPPEREEEWGEVAKRYALAVPPALAALIDRADPADPIARQVLPDARELVRAAHEQDDPIGDDLKSPTSGLVHRYPDRVLLKLTSACAVYCRFCFRRESVGPGGPSLDEAGLAAALDYLRARPEIWEVVLTGGDPLALSPRRVAQATRALADLAHIKVLRWHTRMPVAAPERIDDALAAALTSGHDKAVYVAVHANHPRELTPQARAACRRLLAAGVSLVSQTVLLKGVNDDADTLAALMRGFVETRIKPYYLHHPDPAPGTGHFRVSLAEGQALMRALRARVSGLAMPTYVVDLPEARGKIPVGPSYLEGAGPVYVATDPNGGQVRYSDAV